MLRFNLLALSTFAGSFISSVNGLEIRRIGDQIPTDRDSRRVSVSGDGNCFVYESEEAHHFDGTEIGDTVFAENVKHTWKTCGVFGDGEKVHHFMSYLGTSVADDKDDDAPRVSDDGMHICYHTDQIGVSTVIALVDYQALSYIGRDIMSTDDLTKRKSNFCDISPDGGSVVFQSTSALVPGVSNLSSKYQIYLTHDRGVTYTLVAGNDIANDGIYSLLSSYPQVSQEGKFVSFIAKLPYEDETVTIKTTELYLYSTDAKENQLKRLTSFNENYCDLEFVFEKMKEYWGEEEMAAEDVIKASSSQCNFAAVRGWQTSGKLLGAGHGPARITNNGRFITYAAGFDHATIRGTYESPQVITADNLFLFDTHLGLIWQITKEGDHGDPDAFQKRIEDYTCPTASFFSSRDGCSQKKIFMGLCCWQRTSWLPVQWPDISGDGTSIAFFTTFPHNGGNEVSMDNEIYHYHIPTNKFTVVTNTTDKNYDDGYPSISHDGTVIGFETMKYDHITEENVGFNQAFAAQLTYGCPQFTAAENYHPSPDVPVLCILDTVPDGTKSTKLMLTFEGDVGAMISNIPFPENDANSIKEIKERFCNTYIDDVQRDIAFALEIPLSMVKIAKGSNRGCRKNWSKGISVAVIILGMKGLPHPDNLRAKLKQMKTGNGEGALSKGYLTKTLKPN